MNADDLRPIVLVVLALTAVGVAAAAIDVGGFPSETGEQRDGPETPESQLPNGTGPPGFDAGFGGLSVSCPAALSDPSALGGAVLVVFALGGLAYRVRRSAVVPVVVGGPVVVGLVSLCGGEVGIGSRLHAVLAGALLSTPFFLGLLLVTVGSVVAILYRVMGSDERLDPVTAAERPDVDLAAVGEAAGAAADRIERQADVTNEVYRAWHEMTRHLEVANPEATTPAEFAAAAIEAGMHQDDVDTLTRLFEEVRYGDADPAAREEQALAALRRIEREYGGDEA